MEALLGWHRRQDFVGAFGTLRRLVHHGVRKVRRTSDAVTTIEIAQLKGDLFLSERIGLRVVQAAESAGPTIAVTRHAPALA